MLALYKLDYYYYYNMQLDAELTLSAHVTALRFFQLRQSADEIERGQEVN